MTQTTATLRRQIKTAQDLRSVVSTMRALAAVNIRQYQETVATLEEYRKTIELGFQIIVKNSPQLIPEPVNPPQNMIAVIIGSDQGLVGQFNQHVVQHMQQNADDPQKLIVCAVGHRLSPHLDDIGYRADSVMHVPGSRAGITPTVRDLLLRIAEWREVYPGSQLKIFYNHPAGHASYKTDYVDLLPLNPQWFKDLHARPWQSRSLPISRIEWMILFRQFVQQHFFATIYFALVSSLASENASRLASMESAKDNIDNQLDELEHRFNRQRQQTITEELFDVIAGFEMLS